MLVCRPHAGQLIPPSGTQECDMCAALRKVYELGVEDGKRGHEGRTAKELAEAPFTRK